MVNESLLAHAEARHARDEAERANCAKDDFLAILSHELRTPPNPTHVRDGLGHERVNRAGASGATQYDSAQRPTRARLDR
jgi:hypothetical protein